MLHKAIQNRWCRLALAVAATLLYAIGVNWFIVPMGLYTGGLLGFCQVARTLIVEALGLSPNVDFSGVLYLAANVPILLLAWQFQRVWERERNLTTLRAAIQPTAHVAFMLGLIFVITKDMGSALVYVGVFLAMALAAGVR